MNWLDKLERKFGRFAIDNLMSYIIVANAVIFLLAILTPSAGNLIISKLAFDPYLVKQGEIWRFLTFIFIPPTSNPILGIFVLLFYYSIGSSLEANWGAFRFNIYYLIGMIGTAIVSLLFGIHGVPTYINASLFLAYAKIYAESSVRLFFILPVKVKFLGWIYWAVIIITAITGGISHIILSIVAYANYFLFFGSQNVRSVKTRRKVSSNKKRFKKDRPKVINIHRCTKCGITDRDDSDMEFRYCSSCEGDYEYCMDHIDDHEHK